MIHVAALILLSITSALAIQCYSGSQLQVIECPSVNCIKQTLGFDTVRYCDGSGVSSVCQTYHIFDRCETIPNLGHICCCSENLCNSAYYNQASFTVIITALAVAIALRIT